MKISRLIINDEKQAEQDVLSILDYTEIINTQIDKNHPIERKDTKHIYPEASRYRDQNKTISYNKDILLKNPVKKDDNYFIAPSLIKKEGK